MENSQASTLNPGKRRLLLWDMLRWPIAAGRGSTSSLLPSPAPHQAPARLPSEVPITRSGTSHPIHQAGG